MKARQLLILDIDETFLVRPTRTLAHLTPLSLPTKAQTPTQMATPLVQPPFRSLAPVHALPPRRLLPPGCLRVVRRDGAAQHTAARRGGEAF